jgi:hypothetical protein
LPNTLKGQKEDGVPSSGFSSHGFLLNALLASASHMNLPIMAFDEGYAHLFGDDHLVVLKDRKTVHLSLDETYWLERRTMRDGSRGYHSNLLLWWGWLWAEFQT